MSDIWANYQKRVTSRGDTRRDAAKRREERYIKNRILGSLSYFSVSVDDEEREVCILDSDNYNEKTMVSMPGEDFDLGSIVDFADNHWLVTEKDPNNEIYTRAKLVQCNFLLRWIDRDDHEVHEQWCIVNDGTKLERDSTRNSLVRWKRRTKSTSLIAGNSLEPSLLQRETEQVWA